MKKVYLHKTNKDLIVFTNWDDKSKKNMKSQKKFQDITKGLKDSDTIKMRVDEFNQGIEEVQIEFFKRGGDSVFGQDEKRTKTSIVAAIINNNFLESDYQGKDWESVRKTLIKELSSL